MFKGFIRNMTEAYVANLKARTITRAQITKLYKFIGCNQKQCMIAHKLTVLWR